MPRTASAHGPLLWCRALLLATVGLLTGTLGHVSAHGRLPGPEVLAVLLVAGTALAAPLLRDEASRRRVVVLLVLGQAGVHAALTLLGGHQDEAPPTGRGPAWLDHLSADLTGAHAAMALGHAAAATAVGLWLASGERLLWGLLRHAECALSRWARRCAPVPVAGRPVVVPVRWVAVRARPLLLTLDAPRRGPPDGPRAAAQPAGF